MALELVTPLPPGAPSHTRLAKHGARLVVLREIKDGTDCSWPQPSPHMVTLQEVGELQGKRHALFPWVPGVTLRELVKALEVLGKPVPLGLIGRVLVDAARALSAVNPPRPHGGLQDAALQIGFDGQVSVLDWGAPRISRFRPIGRVNFAADVFALGGVLHAVLTGFAGDYASPPVALASPSNSHPEATPAIDDVVLRALSAQPDSRQKDAATFADELEAVLGEQLFPTARLSEVVRTLFKERIKLLQSLGGLIEEVPNLEAVLPVPPGTQPGVGGPLPRMESAQQLVGEGSLERTDVRIALPPQSGGPSRSMVPWDSSELPAIVEREVPPGPRPSSPSPRVAEPATNPRVELPLRFDEPETNPRAAVPERREPAEVAEGPPPPKVSAPRPSRAGMSALEGADAEDTQAAALRPGRSPADTDPRGGSPRPARSPADPDETNGRAMPSRPAADARPARSPADTDETNGQAMPSRPAADARPARSPADTDETGGDSGPARSPADTDESSAPQPRASAPRPLGAEEEHAATRPGGPRALSRSDVEVQRPRASSPRPADSDADVPKTVANELDDTNPRARAPEDTAPRAPRPPSREEVDAGDTGPLPAPPPRPRNTTEAERQRAIGQERLRTPPQGVPALGDEDEALLNEPTAVRPRPDPQQTAQTAQTAQQLKPAPAPASSGAGLRAVMVVLLLVVVGLAAAVAVKLKRQAELPLPMDETLLEVDAGPAETERPDAGPATVVMELPADAGDEEEEDDADGGEVDPVDAGPAPAIDAGAADAGVKAPVKKPVKRPVKKVKKKKRR